MDEKEMSEEDVKEAHKDSKKKNEDEGNDGDDKIANTEATKSVQQMQKERFEYHQEMLERFTESLSELAEKPLNEIDRVMVVNQTRVVDRFMKNMLKYVEDGMEDTS